VKSGKKIVIIVTVVFLIITGILPVYADQLDDQQRRLEELNMQINQKKQDLNEVKKQENSVMDQINKIGRDITNIEMEIDSLKDNIDELEKELSLVETEIEKSEEELAEQTEILKERLVFIYEKGDISYLEVLLNAADLKDFLSRYDMLNYILEQDMELIDTVTEKKHELEMKKSDLEVKRNELSMLQEDRENKKVQLASRRAEQTEYLQNIGRNKTQLTKALEELEQASNELEAMLQKVQSGNGNTSYGTGTYTWPTPGWTTITSSYGMRFHPILKVNKMHTGVDIGAPRGANIVAVDGGKVAFVGWMSGYGQVVLLDHGNKISTLYVHQDRILVSKGQVVEKGQTIGKVGSTGWSTGPHLHFEVRINGKHTNPLKYIK